MDKSFTIHVCVFVILTTGISCTNSPPSLSSSKDWTVYEDDEVGDVVTTLRASDFENDPVSFTLVGRSPSEDIHTYFKIDGKRRVKVVKPLTGLAGPEGTQHYIVRVRLDDGTTATFTEVKLQVFKTSSSSTSSKPLTGNGGGYPPLPPVISNPFPGGGIPTNIANGVPNLPSPFKPSPPLLQIDSHNWNVFADTPVGSFIQNVGVIDIPGLGYNLTLEGSRGLLQIDSSGTVRVAASLSSQIGNLPIKVVVSNSQTKADELVTLRVLPPLTTVTAPPSSIVTTATPRPTVPTSKGGNQTKNSQDYIVVKGPGSQDSTSGSSPSGKTTGEEPEEGPGAGISLTIIPIVLFAGVSPLALTLYCYWRRIQRRKARAEAKESAVVYTEKAEEAIGPQVLPRWSSSTSTTSPEDNNNSQSRNGRKFTSYFSRRAASNKYEDFKPGEGRDREGLGRMSSPVKDNWEFPRHHLKFLGILGEGCFGQVWKCEAVNLSPKGPMLVAVKTLKECAGERERRDLVQELKVLKNLGKHINVVSLLGCCTEKDPLFIILEYMCGGKLQSFLRASRADAPYNNLHGTSSSLSAKDLTIYTYQIARGMDFLARNGIIHRDLAARNVLVGEDNICKVADFGFARDVANNRIYERKSDGRLPIRWMAPESLFDNIFTTKSDVWSFGVLLWEIVTLGSTPYPGLGAAEVMKKVKDGYRLEKPDHCRREVYNIMYYCWDKNPNERPSFTELVHTLESLLLSEVEYIELDRYPDHSYYNIVTEKSDELL